jgi:tyrosyl-tRNA synthetase
MYQITDANALDHFFNSGDPIVCYVGYDPTAESLHVGHLLWISLVSRLQKAGVKPIVLAGGATGKIGDPTWRDTQRVMLSQDTVSTNIKSIQSKLVELIKFDGIANCAVAVNNGDWISKINYMEFLRDFGPLFSINKMLTMDSVSSRLARQQHLSFLEFNYMLLQAYDFWYLFENYDCKIQMGGADQWSNMISGADLIRRKTGKSGVGWSLPLLTNADGKKMGKTESGAVWLDEKLTSPFDFWQYWRNVDDRDVARFLKLFTDMSTEEAEGYNGLVGSRGINEGKVRLADHLTAFVHPSAKLDRIKSMAEGMSSEHEAVDTFSVDKGTKIDSVLLISKLAGSLTAAKRLVAGKGVRVDGRCVESYLETVSTDCTVSVGKKKFVRIIIK